MSSLRRLRLRGLGTLVLACTLSSCIVDNPRHDDVVEPADVRSVVPAYTLSYGPARAHVVDVYLPDGWDRHDRRPVLVYIHGGAWMSGDRSLVSAPVLAQVERGWVVLSADYRLAPGAAWPAQALDVDRLIRWVHGTAPHLGVDPDAIVVAGHSAGAQLALHHGLAPQRTGDGSVTPRVAGVVSLAAPTDLRDIQFTVFGYSSDLVISRLFGCRTRTACDPALLDDASPLTHVSADDPPVYLAHGVDDPVVPLAQALQLYDAFAAVGLEGQTLLDIVDDVTYGRHTRPLPATSRGHDIDAGVHRSQLEAFLDDITAHR